MYIVFYGFTGYSVFRCLSRVFQNIQLIFFKKGLDIRFRMLISHQAKAAASSTRYIPKWSDANEHNRDNSVNLAHSCGYQVRFRPKEITAP